MLGTALLCAPWLPSFQHTDREEPHFKPQSFKFGYWVLAPLAAIYVVTNASVLVLSFFPVNEQQVLGTTLPTLPYFTEVVAALGVTAFGVFWWCWDLYILPSLGYKFRAEEETHYSHYWRVDTLRVNYYVSRVDLFILFGEIMVCTVDSLMICLAGSQRCLWQSVPLFKSYFRSMSEAL